jgi:excisionase family DNA binding protein
VASKTETAQYERLLTAQEVGVWLRVHVNTLKRWTNEGQLPCYRLGERGDLRFRPSDVERFLSERYDSHASSDAPLVQVVFDGWTLRPGCEPTPREVECLALAVLYGRDEASVRLGISRKSVNNALTRLFSRLEVERKEEAMMRLGWLKIPAEYSMSPAGGSDHASVVERTGRRTGDRQEDEAQPDGTTSSPLGETSETRSPAELS